MLLKFSSDDDLYQSWADRPRSCKHGHRRHDARVYRNAKVSLAGFGRRTSRGFGSRPVIRLRWGHLCRCDLVKI